MTFVFRNKKGEETQPATQIKKDPLTYCTKHFNERDKRIMEDVKREAEDHKRKQIEKIVNLLKS